MPQDQKGQQQASKQLADTCAFLGSSSSSLLALPARALLFSATSGARQWKLEDFVQATRCERVHKPDGLRILVRGGHGRWAAHPGASELVGRS